jgi:hypothetical protein
MQIRETAFHIHFISLVCVGAQVAEGQGCVLVHS